MGLASYRSHIGRSQLAQLNLLPVESLMSWLKMIHKMLFGSAQLFLLCLITKVKTTDNICTRHRSDVLPPYTFKTLLGKGTFAYIGAVQWNKLDSQIKVISSLNSFKKRIKAWLIERVAELSRGLVTV